MRSERAGDSIKLVFEDAEAEILMQLFSEMHLLLSNEEGLTDKIQERLFPNTYEDPQEQATYKELIGDQLRSTKLETFEKVRTALAERDEGTVLVPQNDVDVWLAGLTDTRLALGTRLQVTEEVMDRDIEPEDPDAAALSVLHWLGWVQESILKELNSQAGKGGEPSASEG